MKYENPELPEGINVGDEHPLKEFFLLAVGALAAVVLLVALLAWSAQYLAQFIPFRVEQALAEKVAVALDRNEGFVAGAADIQQYLDDLATRIAKAEGLPEEMAITVHYVEDETINAFATLGGHIFILSGLVARLPNENALAMVVAHEIAHVKHRDPIVALGRGLTISVALATLAGLTDSSLLEGVLNQAGVITALKFNRTQEEAADDAALGRIYGHVHGAGELFEILRAGSGVEPPAFFSTHPVTDERVAKIEALTRGTPVRALIELPTFEGTAD